MSSLIHLFDDDEYEPQYTPLERRKMATWVWLPTNLCDCCCTFILLGIAAGVIVLSLIPVYLYEREAYDVNPCTVGLAVSYGTNMKNTGSLTVTNINAIAYTLTKVYNFKEISINSITITSSSTTKTTRKRRQTGTSVAACQRSTSTTGDVLTIVFSVKYPSPCPTVSSKNKILSQCYAQLQGISQSLNLQLTFTNGQIQNVQTFFCSVDPVNQFVQPGSLAVQQQGIPISQDTTNNGIDPTTTFSEQPSTIPAGSTATISGQPSTTAADSIGTTATEPITISEEPTATTTNQLITTSEEATAATTNQPITTSREPTAATINQLITTSEEPTAATTNQLITTSEEATATTTNQLITTSEEPTATTTNQLITTSEEPTAATTNQPITTSEEPTAATTNQLITTSEEPTAATTNQPITTSEEPTATTTNQLITTSEEPTAATTNQPITTSEEPTATTNNQLITTSEEPTAATTNQPITTSEEPTVATTNQLITASDVPTATTTNQPITTSGEPTAATTNQPITTSEEPTAATTNQLITASDEPTATTTNQLITTSEEATAATTNQLITTSEEPTATTTNQLITTSEEPTAATTNQLITTSEEATAATTNQLITTSEEPTAATTNQPITTSEEPTATTNNHLITTSEEATAATTNQLITTSEEPTATTTNQLITTSEEPTAATTNQPITTSREPTAATTNQPITTSEEPTAATTNQLITASDEPTATTNNQLITTPEEPTATTSNQLIITSEVPTATTSNQLITTSEEPTAATTNQLITTPEEPTAATTNQPVTTSEEPTATTSNQLITTSEEPTATTTNQLITTSEQSTATTSNQLITTSEEPTATTTNQPISTSQESTATITDQPTTSITTYLTSTMITCTSTTCSIRGYCSDTATGPFCSCTSGLYGPGKREVFTTSGDMTDNPSGTDTTLGAPYIDAISITARGLVTTVSFYANSGCHDNDIRFGAFQALTSLSTSTVFQLVTQTGSISVDRSSYSSSMQRVDISLCVLPNTPSGCQANAFVIEQGQYFGSYASSCRFGYFPLGSSPYPKTYYRYSYDPFTSANPTATYVNDFDNVVLQEITIAQLTTDNCDNLCIPNPCDTNALCTSITTSYSCACNQGYIGSGAKGDCTSIYASTAQPCTTGTQFGYVTSDSAQQASPAITYIDAVAVNVPGLVTQVSFYAAQTCKDSNIYFGAFSALTAISSSTQFDLTTDSNPLSVDRTSDSDTSMKLVTISLCISSSNPVGCQGQAFMINSGQYMGSYAHQCVMGYVPVSRSVYPSTYYQRSSPFPNAGPSTGTYVDDYSNVVLQYITVQSSASCIYTSTST